MNDRQKIKQKREKAEQKHAEWVKKIQDQWKPGEWKNFREKLEKLSLVELRNLTNTVGIKFTVGNDKITNKEEFILVLDETDKEELFKEYNKIIENRKDV